MRDSRDEMMVGCIQDCETCHALCVRTLAHCLQRGGEFTAHDHVTVLLDRIQICDVSRDFMLRGQSIQLEYGGTELTVTCQGGFDRSLIDG